MNFSLNKSIDLLERTPDAFRALFHNSTENWDIINEGENTWSAYNIIGHLIHGEKTDWIPRAEIILGDSDDKTFEAYDRFAQEKLYSSQTTDELLNEFKILRTENISKLRQWDLQEEDLNKRGIHPDLGNVSLRELISTWTIHDMSHLYQASRVIVKHYSDDVGPWRKYSRILKE